MKYPKFCNECRWSEPHKQYSQLLVCVHRRVTGADDKAVVSIYPSKECYHERSKYWNPCGKPGRLFEYDRKEIWTATNPTAISAATAGIHPRAITGVTTSMGAMHAAKVGLNYWNAGCTDPDNCQLCKAAKLPGGTVFNLHHAGIPTVRRDG